MNRRTVIREPDYETACGWWADLPNIFTTLGWKEHAFRFNALWNGTLMAYPDLNRRTKAWAGQGVQVAFAPHYTEWFPGIESSWHAYLMHDDGLCRQGWEKGDAPVLWTDIPRDGVVHRIRTFIHKPGGAVKTGTEPLFAWVRLSVHKTCAALPLEANTGFNLIIQNPHMQCTMSTRRNVVMCRENNLHVYTRELKTDAAVWDPAAGLRILEPDGRVRLAAAPGGNTELFKWFVPGEDQKDYRLWVRLPMRVGASADFLIPMLACDRAAFDEELALGYKGALADANRFWKKALAPAVRFETPDEALTDTLRQSLRFSQVTAEKNPETGQFCKVTGSWAYANLWTTPMALELVFLMDMFGMHGDVGRWLDIFRNEQGTVTPPGSAYTRHPGFFSTPPAYKSIDWISDNGAILWSFAMHGLLSGDRAFAKANADALLKSCEWIRDMRAAKGHGGVEGLLPPGVATDSRTEIQAVWSSGWNYLGLCAAVRLLKRIGHPRADEMAAEAASFKETFVKAFRVRCRKAPGWTDKAGRRRRLPPTSFAGEAKAEWRHAFMLDAGALFLVFSGLMEADDPLMRDILDWFREGPQMEFYRRDSNCWQVPVLDHEMSSCEPCYSWNVFHSWQSGDRTRFLEGFYSLMAGSVSRQTRISCETRGGITGNLFSASLLTGLARLAAVDERWREGELHLLRLAPAGWFKPGACCRIEDLPTEHGPVSLRTRVSADGKTLDIAWKPRFRDAPGRVVLHKPPVDGLVRIRVNGRPVKPGRMPVVL